MPLLNAKQMLEYTEPIVDDLRAFETRLADNLRGDSPLISSVARHLLTTKGKRIRPAFLFLTSRASDTFTEHTVDASLAIELIHTATLLHDDVIDESDLRRGQTTVNAKWNNLVSVLMGDYLFAKAFRIMVGTDSMALIDSISRATERVSVGELRQIEESANYELTEDAYLEIIGDKTASLFAVACEAGPILARMAPNDRRRLADFGEKIGISFQIVDDLLDFIGEPEATGKELGNDVISGKVTLPLIHSLAKVSEASGREMVGLLRNEDADNAFPTILRFVTEQGGIDYAYRRAEELAAEALTSLGAIGDSTYAACLRELVSYTTNRTV